MREKKKKKKRRNVQSTPTPRMSFHQLHLKGEIGGRKEEKGNGLFFRNSLHRDFTAEPEKERGEKRGRGVSTVLSPNYLSLASLLNDKKEKRKKKKRGKKPPNQS